MSRPSLELTSWQFAELRRFADGKPHRPQGSITNLIRRNILELCPRGKPGNYQLTPFGREVLEAAENELTPSGAAEKETHELEAVLLSDVDVWPRDDLHRYRVYVLAGDVLTCLAACPNPGGVGVALVQLDADERAVGGSLSELGVVGVLDAVERLWIVKPFPRRDPPTAGLPPPPKHHVPPSGRRWRAS